MQHQLLSYIFNTPMLLNWPALQYMPNDVNAPMLLENFLWDTHIKRRYLLKMLDHDISPIVAAHPNLLPPINVPFHTPLVHLLNNLVHLPQQECPVANVD